MLQTNCSCRFRHRQREQQHPRRCFHLRRDLAWPRTMTQAEGSPPRRRTPAPRLGHRSQGFRKGPGPSRHLDRPLRSLSQLSHEDICNTQYFILGARKILQRFRIKIPVNNDFLVHKVTYPKQIYIYIYIHIILIKIYKHPHMILIIPL
jgi:hypothetical protein